MLGVLKPLIATLKKLSRPRYSSTKASPRSSSQNETSQDETRHPPRETRFVHNPLPKGKYFRLLCLLPGQAGDTICCTIAQYSLSDRDNPPAYTAISYHWGEEDCTQKIIINGQMLYTTKNAQEVLQHTRSSETIRLVWIDSVCINQNDDSDKDSQIRLMGLIYTNALETVAWIGPATEDSNRALDFITEHSTFFSTLYEREVKMSGNPLEVMQDRGISEKSNIWIDVIEATNRPWFGRLWVVQELCLSSDAKIACGDRIVSWNAFSTAIFMSLGFADVLSRTTAFEGPLQHKQVMDMTQMQQDIRQSRKISMGSVLKATRYFDARKPHDYVFGLLGLVGDEQLPLSHLGYGDAVEDLYQAATEIAIESNNDLSILYGAEPGEMSKLLHLPSWVPDFSDKTFRRFLPSDAALWPTTDAFAGHSEPGREVPKVSFHGRIMTVRGIIGDAITVLGPVYNDWDTMNGGAMTRIYGDHELWHPWCRIMLRDFVNESSNEDREGDLDALLDMLFEGEFATPQQRQDSFSSWKRHYIDGRSDSGPIQDVAKALRYNFMLSVEERQRAVEFAEKVEFTCRGRRLCITGSNVFGLVPRTARLGDVVGTFLGSSLPFILRSTKTAESCTQQYQLVGTCRWNGTKRGDAIESRALESIEIV